MGKVGLPGDIRRKRFEPQILIIFWGSGRSEKDSGYMPQTKPHFASQAFSLPHSPSQPVPNSQQKVAELSGAVLLEE